MKRILVAMLFALALYTGSANAQNVRVVIPSYKCIIGDCDVYYADSQYPLISYKDITYFPMTYDYCRALNLISTWTGSELYIAYNRSTGSLPVYDTQKNAAAYNASLPSYPIYINGKLIDNQKEEYPLLNFRGVTYFPMTWRFAAEEFNWTVSWENNTFTLLTYREDTKDFLSRLFSLDSENALLHRQAPSDYEDEYFRLNYKTEQLTKTTLESEGFASYDALYQTTYPKYEKSEDVTFDGTSYLVGGVKLGTVKHLENGGSASDLSGYASVEEMNGIKFLNVVIYTSTPDEIPPPYTPFERYGFLILGGKYVFVQEDAYFTNCTALGDDIYVNAIRYIHWKGMATSGEKLYKISADGSVMCINDLFPDYGSMKLIGAAQNKLYLKCEWANNDIPPIETYEVSAANDGYFCYENEKLTKLFPWIYTGSDIASPDGKIFVIKKGSKDAVRIY